MKKKLAFFIDEIGWGGAEKSMMSLLRHLKKEDIDVDVFTVSFETDDSEALKLLPSNVRHYSIPIRDSGLCNFLCRLRYYLKRHIFRRLGIERHWAQPFWETMKSKYPQLKDKYDVAIAYQQGMITYYVAEKVTARKKIAWINSNLSAHGHDVKYSRKYYDMYDHVVAVCEEQRKVLSYSGYVEPSRLTTIYDIVDENEIGRKASEKCEIDRTHDWVIVTVARLAPEKNLGLAVEAANILRAQKVDFVWYIVGGGVMEVSLREKIANLNLDDYVTLTGVQNNPYKYMKAADVYVQTSKSEGFGMTIAEAKILGRPVVSTNFQMVYDQIQDGINGLIAKMTPESVAEKIMCLISDPNLRANIEINLAKEKNMTYNTDLNKFFKLIYE